jgi:hypothetical protein
MTLIAFTNALYASSVPAASELPAGSRAMSTHFAPSPLVPAWSKHYTEAAHLARRVPEGFPESPLPPTSRSTMPPAVCRRCRPRRRPAHAAAREGDGGACGAGRAAAGRRRRG